MAQIWREIGFIHWPLAFSTLWIVGLSLYCAARLFGAGARPDPRTRAWVDAVLFWGGFAAVAGILGTLVGIVVAAQSIEAAGAVSTSLVWGGIKIAMMSSVLGVLLLALASLSWFVLQFRWRQMDTATAET